MEVKTGFLYLKKDYQDSFWQAPSNQGLIECFTVVLFHYLYSTYNDKWFYFMNTAYTFFIFTIIYFESRLFMFKSKTVPNLMKVIYLPLCYYFLGETRVVMIVHYFMILIGVSQFRKNLPKGLTFGEMFTAFAVNAWYFCYFIEGIYRKKEIAFMAGYNFHNAIIFAPVSNTSDILYPNPSDKTLCLLKLMRNIVGSIELLMDAVSFGVICEQR